MNNKLQPFGFFDTIIDTKKNFVTKMKVKITPHTYLAADGTSQLYLHATANSRRVRVPLKIYVNPKKWDPRAEKINDSDTNLLIGEVKARVNKIMVHYRLSDILLTPEQLKKELQSAVSFASFYAFWQGHLEQQRPTLKPGTYRAQCSVLKVLQKYQRELYFSEITFEWIEDFKAHQFAIGKQKNTVYSLLKNIKKYLNAAKKRGVKLAINTEDIKVRQFRSHRTALTAAEVKRLEDYYHSDYCSNYYKTPLCLFLFSCFTSLRIGDVLQLDPYSFEEGYIKIQAQKTNKYHQIKLTNKAQAYKEDMFNIIGNVPTPEYINRTLKEIAKAVNIRKRLTFHVARHTFATLYLKVGGKVETLQETLGHSNIRETMLYVHLNQEQMDSDIDLMDNL